ncbi:MAG: serine hydrolase, partial [Bacteroidetes bacterium]|nr:serine hydrolase [Bacteroidota bacterium]
DYNGNTPVFGWNPSAFLADVHSLDRPVVWVEFDRPWILPELVDHADAIIQAWDGSSAMAEGTADVLFGLAPGSGRLPVNVGTIWPRGSGLDLPAHFSAPGRASDAGLDPSVLSRLDFNLDRAMADSAFPAAALAVGRDLTVAYQEVVGYHTFERMQPLAERDLFDMASLTKVLSTTTAIMLLVEEGQIDLDRPVADYLPEFGQNGKGMVTVRHLLTHTGGLIPFRPFHMQGVRSGAEVRRLILADTLVYEPGTQSRYSDFGPITLAWMIEAITGQEFGSWVNEHVFRPLGMVDTGYLSSQTRNRPDAVPTEVDDYFRRRTLQGEVHDETAWLLGGTAGHAGLFSTIRDLERFAGMLSREGRVGGLQFLRPETLRHFTSAADPTGQHTRALGWDTKSMIGYSSAGSRFGPRSFGHTGFTGTSLWFDPDSHLYVILLTNRVHPTRDNRRLTPLRPAVANVAFESMVRAHSKAAAQTE